MTSATSIQKRRVGRRDSDCESNRRPIAGGWSWTLGKASTTSLEIRQEKISRHRQVQNVQEGRRSIDFNVDITRFWPERITGIHGWAYDVTLYLTVASPRDHAKMIYQYPFWCCISLKEGAVGK